MLMKLTVIGGRCQPIARRTPCRTRFFCRRLPNDCFLSQTKLLVYFSLIIKKRQYQGFQGHYRRFAVQLAFQTGHFTTSGARSLLTSTRWVTRPTSLRLVLITYREPSLALLACTTKLNILSNGSELLVIGHRLY